MTAVPPRRVRLSRWATPVTREAAFQSADAVELDSSEFFQLTRRRVLFEDVRLVTLHRRRGIAYIVAMAAIALMFLAPAGIIVAATNDGWIAALFFVGIALFPLTFMMLRIILGIDVITVFGRRSKIAIRFQYRKRRAREVYGSLCAAIRNAQRERPATSPGSAGLPLPEGVPLPPP